jgi:chemotaxis regulatin CheY-phosphate phosphatase CheZ
MYQSILESIEGELWELIDEMNEKPLSESIGRTSRFLHYADRTVEVPLNQFETEKQKMPTIAEQIKAAKARIAEVRAGAATSAAEAANIAQIAAEEVAKLEKMNEELRAELAGLNGGEPL